MADPTRKIWTYEYLRKYQDTWSKKRRDKHKKLGLCITCVRNPRKAIKNQVLCKYHKKLQTERSREYHIRLKQKIIKAYGGKCRCCGETMFEFLSVDHVNGGGSLHRKRLKIRNFYRWLLKHNFPKRGFRLLCFNCNLSIGFYGSCPHRRRKLKKKVI